MIRALASLVLLAATTAAAAPRPDRPRLADQEARVVASETRAASLDRRRQEQARRLVAEELPTTELLAALQRAALHPPLASLAEPGSIGGALQKRAILSAALPAIVARTTDLRRDVAALGTAQAAARDQLRDARLRLAILVETMRGGDGPGSIGPGSIEPNEQRRLAELPAPPLRPAAASYSARAAQVYRLPLPGAVIFGTGEAIGGGGRAQGLTIATAAGAPVRAPATGRVAYAGPFGGYGRIVILDHGHGWTSLVAGLATTGVAPGASVAAGAPLGRMPATPSRLTLELKRDGRIVDVAAIAAWRGA